MVLFESNNYIIRNEYETTYLVDKKDGKIISIIADMYGDPVGASVSDDESYCIVFGCGAVVYYMKEPFQNYEYGYISKQWFEVDVDGSVWFEKIKYQDAHQIMLLSENYLIYDVDIDNRTFFTTRITEK